MENKYKNSYKQYRDPFNFFESVMFAVLGTLPGLLLWILLAFVPAFHYAFPIMIGVLAMVGARYKQYGKQLFSVVIAVLIALLAVIAGDVLETLIITGDMNLELVDYLIFALQKSNGNRMGYYGGAMLVPLVTEFIFRRAEKHMPV